MSGLPSPCLLFYNHDCMGPGVAGGRGAYHPPSTRTHRHRHKHTQCIHLTPRWTSEELNGPYCVAESTGSGIGLIGRTLSMHNKSLKLHTHPRTANHGV